MAAGDLALAISISAIDSASSVIKGIADSLVNLAGEGALGAVAAAGVAAAAGLVAVGVAGAKAAGDFQQQLNMLVTSAGESASNLGMVSDGILKISTDTGTATSDLTSAMYNINSGGKIGADGLHILQIASEGAKTENADLTTVTKALMTTMTDYKMPTQDATGAMNGLIAAVQNGRTTLQAMATAMGQVLPVASSMGMSFPQVAGALDALTNAGVTAQQGAQNLAHFLVALQAPSGVAQKSMGAVGISAQDLKDTLVTKGLPAALQMIEDHIGQHLPAGSVQAETAMKNITGGLVGLKAAADITGQGLQKTVDATNKIAAAMGDASKGVSGWDLVQSGFNFQLDRAKAALDAFLIVIGEKLLPVLTPIVAGFTNVVTGISDMISGFNSGGSSGNAFSGILQAMGINTKTLETTIGMLNVTFAYLKDVIGEVGNIFSTLFGAAIQMAGQIIGNFVNNDLQGLLGGLNMFLYNTRDALDAVVQGLGGFLAQFQQVYAIVAPIFDGLATAAQQWGTNFISSFGQGVMSALSGIVDAVVQVVTEIESYLGFASPTRKGPGQNVNKWGRGLAQGLASGMLDGIPDLQDAAGNLMSVTTRVVVPGQQAAMKPAKGNTAAKSLTSGLSSSLASGAGALTSGVAAIGAQLDTVCSTHATAASKCASSKLTTGLASSISSGAGAVKSAADNVGKATSGAGTGAAKSASTAADHLTKGLADKVKAATPKAKKAATDLGAAVAGAIAPAMKVGSDGFNGISKAAGDMANKLKAAGDSAKTALSPLAQGLKAALSGIGPLFDNIKKAAQAAFDYMKPGLASIGNAVETQLYPQLQKLWTIVKPLADDLGKLVGWILKGAIEFGKWATSASTLKAEWDGFVASTKVVITILSTVVQIIGQTLDPVIKQLQSTIKTQLAPSWDALSKAIAPMMPMFVGLAQLIGGILLAALGLLLGALGGILKGLANLTAGLIKALGGIIEFFSGLIAISITSVQLVYDIFTGKWGKLKDDLGKMWDDLKLMAQGLWDTIVGIWDTGIGVVVGFVQGFIDTTKTYFQGLYNDLVGHSIIPDIINGIQDWFNKLLDFIPTLMTKIVKFFTDGWANVQKGVETVLKTINAYWTSYSAAALKIIQDGWTKIQAVFSAAWTTYIQKPLADLQTSVTTWATTLIATAATWGTNLIKGLAASITAAIPDITTAVTAVATTIANFLGIASPAKAGPLSTSDTWMGNLMKMFTGQITAATPGVASATSGLAGAIKTQIDKAVTGLKASIADLQTQINSLKTTAKDTATSVAGSMQQVSGSTKTAMNDSNAAMVQMNQNMLQELQHAQEVNSKLANANNIIVVQTKTTADQVSAADSAMANTSKDTLNTVTTNNAKTTLNMHDSVVTVQQNQTIMDKIDNYVVAQAATITKQMQGEIKTDQTSLQQQTKAVTDWVGWAGNRINQNDKAIDIWAAQTTKTITDDIGWAGNRINQNDKSIDQWWNSTIKTITNDISTTNTSINTSNKTITAAESTMSGQVKQAGTMATLANVYAGQSTVSAAASNTEASLSSTFKSASQSYASGSASYAGVSGNYAGISVNGRNLSGAAATGAAQGAMSSTQSSGISTTMMSMATGAATGAMSAAGSSASSSTISSSMMTAAEGGAKGAMAAASTSTTSSTLSTSMMATALGAAKGAVAAAADAVSSATSAKNSNDISDATAAQAHDTANSTQAYISAMMSQIMAQGASMVAAAQSFAAAAAALVAHSTPKTGPMKDDNVWTAHFVDNLVNPLIAGVPRLARACDTIAKTIAGAVGGATAGGVTSPVATKMTFTTPSSGITVVVPSLAPIVAQPPPQPPVVIHTHVDLDGREVGRCTEKYLRDEVHNQGGYRRR